MHGVTKVMPTEVEEAYKPDNNHMKPLKDVAINSEAKDEENYALTEYLKFAESKRIEIDSVLAKVGNSIKTVPTITFWKIS